MSTGEAVRIEGNEFESMGGPAIFANAVGALAIRSNYFEANWQHGEAFEFQLAEHRSPTAAPCSDIIVNGDDQTVNRTKHTTELAHDSPNLWLR